MKFIIGLLMTAIIVAWSTFAVADHKENLERVADQEYLVKSLNPKEPNTYYGIRIMQQHLYKISQYGYYPKEDVHRFVLATPAEFATTCVITYSRSAQTFSMNCQGPNPANPTWFEVMVTSSDHDELNQMMKEFPQ